MPLRENAGGALRAPLPRAGEGDPGEALTDSQGGLDGMDMKTAADEWADPEIQALLADLRGSIERFLHRKISRPLAPCLVRAKERFGTEVPRESAESTQLPTGGQQTGQIVKQSEQPAA